MKYIFLSLLFCLSGSIFLASVKSEKMASLEIKIMDCRSHRAGYLSSLKIIKDGKTIKELAPQHTSTQTLYDLSSGIYMLEYTSIFNKTETLTVNIAHNQKYTVELCIDYLNYTTGLYNPVIDRLKDNESYSIIMTSTGCFHFTNDTLIINKENGIYKAKMSAKTKTLNAANIEAVKHFEIELNNVGGRMGCTTTDTYSVIYKKDVKIVKDGGCDWKGDYYLKQNLFGNK